MNSVAYRIFVKKGENKPRVERLDGNISRRASVCCVSVYRVFGVLHVTGLL